VIGFLKASCIIIALYKSLLINSPGSILGSRAKKIISDLDMDLQECNQVHTI
jgi:hypothetical protein